LRQIKNAIIHCSDSEWGCARAIRGWHLDRGFKDIGYHFVILNGLPTFSHMQHAHLVPSLDGSIECGRTLDDDGFIQDVEIGAHALGYNDQSIGICVIGVQEFSTKQMFSLLRLLADLTLVYHIPIENILGHCETDSGKAEGKTCPNMDMNKVRGDLKAWQKLSPTFDPILFGEKGVKT
jgi:hypothetical protein